VTVCRLATGCEIAPRAIVVPFVSRPRTSMRRGPATSGFTSIPKVVGKTSGVLVARLKSRVTLWESSSTLARSETMRPVGTEALSSTLTSTTVFS
jgi:hypothetical protein